MRMIIFITSLQVTHRLIVAQTSFRKFCGLLANPQILLSMQIYVYSYLWESMNTQYIEIVISYGFSFKIEKPWFELIVTIDYIDWQSHSNFIISSLLSLDIIHKCFKSNWQILKIFINESKGKLIVQKSINVIKILPQMKHWTMEDFFKGFKFLNKKESTCVSRIFVSVYQRSDDDLDISV